MLTQTWNEATVQRLLANITADQWKLVNFHLACVEKKKEPRLSSVNHKSNGFDFNTLDDYHKALDEALTAMRTALQEAGIHSVDAMDFEKPGLSSDGRIALSKSH